jgi:hypothetical protein
MVDLVDVPDVYGHTVFCDDIRQEITGKFLFVGVYNTLMVIGAPFPVQLPRLCFSISITQRRELFVPKIGFRIFVPGDADDAPSIEGDMGEVSDGAVLNGASAASDAIGIPKSERLFTGVFSNLMFDNFVVNEPGLIKVRADIKGKRYKLGSLRVAQAPAVQNPPSSEP